MCFEMLPKPCQHFCSTHRPSLCRVISNIHWTDLQDSWQYLKRNITQFMFSDVCRVSPRLQWTLLDCLAHHTRLHHRPRIPLAGQTHSWSAGTGPTAYRPPCTQDCQTAQAQATVHYSLRFTHSTCAFGCSSDVSCRCSLNLVICLCVVE